MNVEIKPPSLPKQRNNLSPHHQDKWLQQKRIIFSQTPGALEMQNLIALIHFLLRVHHLEKIKARNCN